MFGSSGLLLVVLGLLIIKNAISIVGKANVVEFLWAFYNGYLSRDKEWIKLKNLKIDKIEIIKEKNSISPQDQYAKWTKLNRNLDKLSKEIELLESNLILKRSIFKNYISYFITAIIEIPLLFIRIFKRNQPMFYLPNGIFPKYVLWILKFPNANYNSVSLNVWIFFINTFINNLLGLIKYIFEQNHTNTEKEEQIESIVQS
ncbi:hypothetical protein PACTADRAFT_565 [Pachysolen tannophilus NRRL Y-2460]|uniref:Golgi to ER traffic protein 1 n=1 Tax=Pachysolen tannophilus NRRL Y-2460 TaxID=669874 RepID=A0A1E4U241_PACTA|nr:hypothetical protein PACTADRAFT_565 [Pachysolen tannophilus NRRL Y-2460]